MKIVQKKPNIKIVNKKSNLKITQATPRVVIKTHGGRGPQGLPGEDGEYPLIIQPETPSVEDRDKLWVDTDDDVEPSYVTSVNGEVGDVIISAIDVGADPEGSADTAEQNANDYTDDQIANLSFVESVQAGSNIAVDNTDPLNPIVSSTAFSGFIYNSAGTQQDNRYNDWNDLFDTIANIESGNKISIYFEQNETLPAGTYNLNDVSFHGNRLNAFQGGITVTIPSGFIAEGGTWERGGIEDSLRLSFTGGSPLIQYSTGKHAFRLGYASLIQSTTEVMFAMSGDATLFMYLDEGATIYGGGYELISVDDTVLVYVFLNGLDSGVYSETFRGDKTSANIALYINSASTNLNTSRTDTNLTGGSPTIVYAEKARNVKYTNNVSGLSATTVQSAIDELASSGSGPQTYDEYIFNSSGTASGNRYNDWSQLYSDAIDGGQEGVIRISFEQNETLPTGSYNLDNIILNGDGAIASLGGLVVTLPQGFEVTSWKNGAIDGGLGLSYEGDTPLLTYESGINLFDMKLGNVIQTSNAPFFEVKGTALVVVRAALGSSLINNGYEVVDIDESPFFVYLAGSSNTSLENNIFRGDVSNATALIGLDSPSSAIDPSRTDANLTGGSVFVQLFSNSALVAYSNTLSSLDATTVQAAIDELKALIDSSSTDPIVYPPNFDSEDIQSELQTLVANKAYAVVGSGYNYDLDGFSMDSPGDFGDGGFDIYTEVVPLWQRQTADADTVEFAEVFTIQDTSAWGGDLVEAATVMRGGRAFPYIELTSSESNDPYGEDPTLLVNDYSTPMFMSTRLRYQYNGDTGTLKVYRTARAGETADDTEFDLDWVEIASTTKGTSWPVAPITYPTWQVGKGGGKHLIARVIVHDYDGTPRADFNPANATDPYTVPDPITGDNWTSPTAYVIQTEDFLQKWLSSESNIPDVPKLVSTDTTTVEITYNGSESTYGDETTTNTEYTGSPRVILSKFVMPEDGELDSITASIGLESAGSCKVRGVVYSNTASAPDELLATGDEITITNTTNSFQEITFSGASRHRFSKGDILWIGVNPEDVSPRFSFSTVGSVTEGTWLSVSVTYANPLPDPAPSFGYFVSGNLALTITYKNAETSISVSTISASNLNTDNSPTDDYVLTAKASAAGGFTWEAVSGGGTPGGSDTQIQFNDGGSFGGDSGLTYNKTTDILTSGGHNLSGSTADRILSTDSSKDITALDTTTYPSLTELTYLKGVTSAIQTQMNAKISASSTDTLTNKTIDANGTGNSITNLETADFATNVIDTDYTMAANSDARLASQKATRTSIRRRTGIIAPTSGDWYSMIGPTSAGSPGSVTAGKLLAHPIMLDVGTIDRIAISTSSAAVSTWRLGLYKADPVTGLPDGQAPFLDAGTVDMNASPGVQSITVNQAITEPGLYWAVIVVDAYTALPTTHNIIYSKASGGGIQGLPQDMNSLGRFRVGRIYTSTVPTGSIPTCPSSNMIWNGVIPRVAVRYA